MDSLKLSLGRPEVAAYLAGGEFAAESAVLLRRWAEPGRPALLLVRDWDPPFADIYPEDELLREFADAPLIRAGSTDGDGMARLLVYVIDEDGKTAYAIPDSRACG